MSRLNPLEGILKPRDLRNPYLAAGIAGRIASNVELNSSTARILDRAMGKIALSNTGASSEPVVPSAAKLWHGTGRYKYINGEIVDVLSGIAQKGAILPNHDEFDLLRPMDSVSLAKSRMYARAYADMFGHGNGEQERYGSSLFWACSFLGSVAIEASKEMRVWKPSGYYKMLGHLTNANAIEWYKKVTRNPNPGVVEIYGSGSDIQSNYPVLFGVKNLTGTKTSRAVSLHEVRVEHPIDVDASVTHVEVPRSRVDETYAMLGGLSVLAIEDGEKHATNYTFTQHMHGIL